jgi:hypothetical protein
MGGDAGISALEHALQDRHAAVRTAAASALGEIGAHRSISALQAATADRSPTVSDRARIGLQMIATRDAATRDPSVPASVPPPTDSAALARAAEPKAADSVPGVRYVLVLGDIRQRAFSAGQDLSPLLRALLTAELRKLEQVAVLTVAELTSKRAHALESKNVPMLRLEGNLRRTDTKPGAGEVETRCEVSLVLLDERERTMRVALKGAASGRERLHGPAAERLALARKTLKGAVLSATGDLLQALEAADSRHTAAPEVMHAEASVSHRHSLRRARAR